MVRRSESNSDGIKVEVAILGGEVKTVFLEEGKTVEDALEAAGFDTASTVKVNGEEVSASDVPEDGDRLIVTSKVKGGC